MCQLRRAPRGADGCLRPQERGPPVRQVWRLPPPPRRERGAKAPGSPEDEIPVTQEAQAEETGEAEVEVEVEPTPEEMEG